MIEKAVIDRFEEDLAVLLTGEKEEEFILPREALPQEAVEGDWLQVERSGDNRIIVLAIDEEETTRARERIAERLRRLRGNQHQQE